MGETDIESLFSAIGSHGDRAHDNGRERSRWKGGDLRAGNTLLSIVKDKSSLSRRSSGRRAFKAVGVSWLR